MWSCIVNSIIVIKSKIIIRYCLHFNLRKLNRLSDTARLHSARTRCYQQVNCKSNNLTFFVHSWHVYIGSKKIIPNDITVLE